MEQKDIIKPLKGIPVPLFRQSDGKPSASFTVMFLASNVCLLWLLLSIVENIGPLKIRAFDFSGVTLFLSPIFGLYFSRRWTDSKGTTVQTIEDQVVKQDEQ